MNSLADSQEQPVKMMIDGLALTPDQVEAIACADAHANNTGLPTYSALLKALQEIDKNDPFRQSSAGVIARAALGDFASVPA